VGDGGVLVGAAGEGECGDEDGEESVHVNEDGRWRMEDGKKRKRP
jgi:hypothetical protein